MIFSKHELQFDEARERMVTSQLVTRGIRDKRVLSVMREIPRHVFVSKDRESYAYDDNPLPIGHGQTISQPYMVAIMTELLELRGEEKALEIGTGCGYQTAILARLCKTVFTVERIGALAELAQQHLFSIGISNVVFSVGDGTLGWPSEAPFDAILVTAGCPILPDTLCEQLAEKGRLVIPIGDRFSQTLRKITKSHGKLETENHTACRFVDLIGKYGWSG
jgi:protein-L-isoaspartate(D-aspartate) O-methyltransferase